MEIKVKRVNKYKEVVFGCGEFGIIDLGLLDKQECKELAEKLRQTANEIEEE